MSTKLLALDPSSSRTGYAVGTGPARADLIDAGLLVPNGGAALRRLRQLRHDLINLLREHRPDAIVLEVPSGKVHGYHRGGGAGLSIYGMAAGVALDVAWHYGWECRRRGIEIKPVDANLWTRGVRKSHRQRCMAHDYQGIYDPRRDPGGDTADALGLLQWWFGQRRAREAG